MSSTPETPILDATDLLENFLTYQEKYDGSVVGFKFGGALAEQREVVAELARQSDILTRSQRGPLLFGVHGGGDQIDAALKEANIEIVRDSRGIRVTDKATMEICDRELRMLGAKIARIFNRVSPNVQAVSLAGYDGRMITGTPRDAKKGDFTGRITKINAGVVKALMNRAAGKTTIPLIYPICYSDEAQDTDFRINVNADDVMAELSLELNASRVLYLTDKDGILDQNKKLISELDPESISALIQNGTITDRMIPKAESMSQIVEELAKRGVADPGVALMNGNKRGCMLHELLGMGFGTLVRGPKVA